LGDDFLFSGRHYGLRFSATLRSTLQVIWALAEFRSTNSGGF
jgi:hypothetical protein